MKIKYFHSIYINIASSRIEIVLKQKEFLKTLSSESLMAITLFTEYLSIICNSPQILERNPFISNNLNQSLELEYYESLGDFNIFQKSLNKLFSINNLFSNISNRQSHTYLTTCIISIINYVPSSYIKSNCSLCCYNTILSDFKSFMKKYELQLKCPEHSKCEGMVSIKKNLKTVSNSFIEKNALTSETLSPSVVTPILDPPVIQRNLSGISNLFDINRRYSLNKKYTPVKPAPTVQILCNTATDMKSRPLPRKNVHQRETLLLTPIENLVEKKNELKHETIKPANFFKKETQSVKIQQNSYEIGEVIREKETAEESVKIKDRDEEFIKRIEIVSEKNEEIPIESEGSIIDNSKINKEEISQVNSKIEKDIVQVETEPEKLEERNEPFENFIDELNFQVKRKGDANPYCSIKCQKLNSKNKINTIYPLERKKIGSKVKIDGSKADGQYGIIIKEKEDSYIVSMNNNQSRVILKNEAIFSLYDNFEDLKLYLESIPIYSELFKNLHFYLVDISPQ